MDPKEIRAEADRLAWSAIRNMLGESEISTPEEVDRARALLDAFEGQLALARVEVSRRFTEAQVREAIQCAWGDATPEDEDSILARLRSE